VSEFKCWCEGMMAIPNSHSCTYEKRIHDLQTKLDCAVKALEFYANTVNYEYAGDKFFGGYARPIIRVELEDVCHVASDEWCLYGGKRARAFLAKKEISQILGKEEVKNEI